MCNPKDKNIWSADKHNVAENLQQCSDSCKFKSSCTSTCMVKALGFSKQCADCFGLSAECVFSNCKLPCTSDPNSVACTNCPDDYCIEPFLQCSGFNLTKGNRLFTQTVSFNGRIQ